MQWYEAEVGQLEKTLSRVPRDLRPAVFYGSSTIRLWSNLAADLEEPRALNVGFGGSTLEACAYFFDRLVPPVSPASLVVYAGDNDLGDGRTPDQVLAFFRRLAIKVEQQLGPISFGFISIKASPARFGIIDRIRAANEMIRQELTKFRDAYYIPIFDAMLSPEGRARPELFGPDGLHMNADGYRLWTSLLAPFHNQIFNSRSPDCNANSLSSCQHESGVPQVVQPKS